MMMIQGSSIDSRGTSKRIGLLVIVVLVAAVFLFLNRIVEGLLLISWVYILGINQRLQRVEEKRPKPSTSQKVFPTNHNFTRSSSIYSVTQPSALVRRASRRDSH